MKKIFIVTSNRADYGLMSHLIYLLKKDKGIKFKLIVTGSHLEKKYGYTLNEIKKDKINVDYTLKIPLQSSNPNKTELPRAISLPVSTTFGSNLNSIV